MLKFVTKIAYTCYNNDKLVFRFKINDKSIRITSIRVYAGLWIHAAGLLLLATGLWLLKTGLLLLVAGLRLLSAG